MFRFLIVSSMLLLAGCKGDIDSQLAGNWKQTAHADNLLEGLVKGMMPKIELDLKADHTFILKLPTLEITLNANSAAATTERRIEGTWRTKDRAAVFTCLTSGGKSVEQVRKDLADAQAQAAQEEHDRKIQEAVRRQMLAAQGYADDTPTDTTPTPKAPTWLKSSDELVLPDRAELSDDGRTITLRFAGQSEQALDLEHQ